MLTLHVVVLTARCRPLTLHGHLLSLLLHLDHLLQQIGLNLNLFLYQLRVAIVSIELVESVNQLLLLLEDHQLDLLIDRVVRRFQRHALLVALRVLHHGVGVAARVMTLVDLLLVVHELVVVHWGPTSRATAHHEIVEHGSLCGLSLDCLLLVRKLRQSH